MRIKAPNRLQAGPAIGHFRLLTAALLFLCCSVTGTAAAPRTLPEKQTEAAADQPLAVLLIDFANPSRPIVNDFVRSLQQQSARRGRKIEITTERCTRSVVSSESGGSIQGTLNPALYQHFRYVILHGQLPYEYAAQCYRQQLFADGTLFVQIVRGDCRQDPACSDFNRLIRAVNIGDSYPQQTLPMGLQAFPESRTLVYCGGKDGTIGAASSILERQVAEFAKKNNLQFYSMSTEEQLSVAASVNLDRRILGDILPDMQRPLMVYFAVELDGPYACDPREFAETLAPLCHKEQIPCIAFTETAIARGLACLGVCTSPLQTVHQTLTEILQAAENAPSDLQRGRPAVSPSPPALICVPDSIYRLNGKVPWNSSDPDPPQDTGYTYYSVPHPVTYIGPSAAQPHLDHAIEKSRLARKMLSVSTGVIAVLVTLVSALVYQTVLRRQAERQLIRQQQKVLEASRKTTLGNFSAALAHELNQPLAAILNNTDAALQLSLTQGSESFSSIREILRDIERDSDRAGAVIGRIRAIVQSETLAIRETDLQQVFEQIQQLAGKTCQLSNIQLGISADDRPLRVATDPVALQIILLNLIENSVQAISEVRNSTPGDFHYQQQISVRAFPCPMRTDRIQIEVIDTGPGLSEQSASEILQPFHTTRKAGLGMGLFIVQTLTEQQSGTIEISPNTPRGLVVTLQFPTWTEKENSWNQ